MSPLQIATSNLVLKSCEKTCTIAENISKLEFKMYYQSNKLKKPFTWLTFRFIKMHWNLQRSRFIHRFFGKVSAKRALGHIKAAIMKGSTKIGVL